MKRRDRLNCRQRDHRTKGRRPHGRRPERRGVLLLVVLSMLVLFLLLGTTFLLTSGQYRTAAKIVEKSHRTTFQPADLLERALMQLVRDTNNATSSIRYHSLLRDLYGAEGFVGRVMVDMRAFTSGDSANLPPVMPANIGPRFAGVNPALPLPPQQNGRGDTEGQIVEFYVADVEPLGAGATLTDDNAVGLDLDAGGLPVEHQLSSIDGYYEGCLLTMLSGPCRGQTVRVIDYDYIGLKSISNGPLSSNRRLACFRVLAPKRIDGRPLEFRALASDPAQTVLTDFVQNDTARTIVGSNSVGLGHPFIINGRPFSGAGVGLNPLAMSSHLPELPSARLSMLELVQGATNYAVEVALTPNSVHFKRENLLRQPVATDGTFVALADARLYPGFAGLGGSNESYDAPDYQNMALAMQSLEPRLRGRVVGSNGVALDPDAYYATNTAAPAYIDLEGVTIPSFHRPDLANFWFHRLMNATAFWGGVVASTPAELSQRARAILEPYDATGAPQVGIDAAQAAQIAALKRKFLLRPLREDHPSFDGSNPLSAYGTTALNGTTLVNNTGELTFPYWEAVGPWDVDNDGDGVNDSVWVDIGLPVQQTEDGRWYKPLVAMLVEDLDGRLNLNAHGSEADMAQADLDASQRVDTSGGVINQLGTNLAYDYNAGASLNSSNQLPGGVGWGVAETSLRPILSPSLPTIDALTASALTGDAQFDDYARTLYGRPDPSTAGRNPSVALRESVTFGRYGSLPGSLPALPLTKPGRTFPTDPAVTAPATRAQTLRAVRDVRTPYDFTGGPLYTAAEHQVNAYEALSGFSSAPDLGGRYAAGLSGAGASVDEPRSSANVRSFDLGRAAAPLSWRELSAAAPDDSPYEVDLSIGARNRPPASLDDVRRSYDPNGTGLIQPQATPISDDAPFSAAELERILRAFDGDAQKLPDRLWKAVDAFDPAKKAAANRLLEDRDNDGNPDGDDAGYTPNSLELVNAGAQAAVTRRQVTTDSWDLPVPNENLYDRLLLGADGKPGVPEFHSIGSWTPLTTSTRYNIPDDDGDGFVDEGDEAITFYNPAGTVDFGAGPIAYDQLFNAGCDDYVVVMRQDPPKNARLTDYLKYRITLEMLRNGRLAVPPGALTAPQLATYHTTIDSLTNPILFGGEQAATAPAGLGSIGGLLSPELLAGRRMDLNRPFGDGRDNNGNGVVDEIEEAGEPFADTNGNGRYDANEPYLDLDRSGDYTASQDRVWIDTDGDGVEEQLPFRHIPLHETFVDRNGVRIYNPQMARQLFARHLYCLMLAMVDENYLAPYDSEDPQVLHYIDPLSGTWKGNAPGPESGMAYRIAADIAGGNPDNASLLIKNRARQLAMRKLTCRMIAQWAVNVVDFRDPDSIQTAFEYDENPWDGWNVVDTAHNRVYPLDGDLTTDENLTMHREIDSGAFTAPLIDAPDGVAKVFTTTNPQTNQNNAEAAQYYVPRKDWTRGVVWGAERPEVLLTEGVAWHDRRLEDLGSETDQNSDGKVVTGNSPTAKKDDDLDQLRKPKGFTYVEAYNPQLGDDQRPAELYSSVAANNGSTTASAGVRLDRLSNAADPIDNMRSPVWRIAVVEEHPLIRNATVPATSSAIGQASDDPVTEQVQQYLGNSILWGPWVYGGDADLTTIVPGITIPLLPNAYREFHTAKKAEVSFALQTSVELATGASITDADGVGVSAGVIERAPTVPDTAFPTFDSFAQPGSPTTKRLSITSTINGDAGTGNQPRTVLRGILTKPTTYIERAMYMAPALNLAPAPGYSGQSTGDYPTANLTNPGLRIPLLSYEVPANYLDGTRLGQEGPHVGVTQAGGGGIVGASSTKSVRVFASKFPNAYDRFTPRQGNTAPSVIGFAPLLPGRRAIIGTTGDTYGSNTQAPTADELARPFEGSVAMRMDNRYAAVISQFPAPVSGGSGGLPAGNVATPKAELRRLEMVPSPDPNRHQFAIRMNGLNESLTVNITGRSEPAFNLTGGEATGFDDATLVAAPPVIAIPIDHFSISEPLDEYLVRQIELDSRLSHYPQPSYKTRTGQAPIAEEYFATTATDSAGKHFDEPFDIHPELVENQTTPNYRSVHLERLANPLLPWNPPPVRPDGQPIGQHNPAMPVNPYLPVDARSLDLTAFNSFSDVEKLLPGSTTTPSGTVGPEQRHKRKRELDTLLSAPANRDTVIGFASNERTRIPGPFPLLWMMEPARLLWRQAGPSTFSEIAHTFANGTNTHNGYLARAGDQLAKPPTGGVAAPGTRLGLEGTVYDSLQISTTPHVGPSNTRYKIDQYIDVAWRLTLGFSDWSSGEFHTGTALRWLTEGGNDGAVEEIDLDGDRNGGDLAGKPEINGVINTQTLDGNGRPTAVNAANLTGTNARTFMESYLRTQIAEQGTTPEFSWPNRPLASAGELLQVPAWGGSRMLTYYSVFNWQFTQNPHFSRRTQVNPYDGEGVIFHDGLDYLPGQNNPGGTGTFDGDFSNDGPTDTITDVNGVRRPQAGSTNVVRFRDMLGHYGHLMNFFQTARFPAIVGAFNRVNSEGTPEDFVVPRGASHFYRVLDYVCVPSRFTATDTILNLDAFSDAGMAIGDARQELAAPFNRVDNYREPGRVNLNTMVGRRDATEPQRVNLDSGAADGAVPRLPDYWSEVYDGLMQRLQDGSVIASGSLIKQGHLGPAWRDVALSRRGYVQAGFNPALSPLETTLQLSSARQNLVDYSPMRMHPDFPTLFANPFRAPGEGANVPLANMVQTGVDATMLRAHPLSPGADGAWGRRGVDGFTVNKSGSGTNAERNGNRNDAGEAGSLPMQVGDAPAIGVVDRLGADTVLARLMPDGNRRGAVPDTFMDDAFRARAGDPNPRNETPQSGVLNTEISKRSTAVPLFSGASLEPSIDTERNSTQRYLPIQRMANLATTRSNVYAVWITVGFFEVKQAKDDARIAGRYFNPDGSFQTPALQELFFRVYPDGWTLGEEIGRDTGQDVRHRGFYVVDRSRPVAFKPGEDANVSETVLVRRRIQ